MAKLSKTEQAILSNVSDKGTVRPPNATKASRDAMQALVRKGLVVQETRNSWFGYYPVEKQ